MLGFALSEELDSADGTTLGWTEPYVNGVYTVFLAGESPNIRSYTVHIQYFGQGNHQI